jgi:predicted nucleic acid-binding Zn ribbon protein
MTLTARSAEHAKAARLFPRYNFRDFSERCTVVNKLTRWSETEATQLSMEIRRLISKTALFQTEPLIYLVL